MTTATLTRSAQHRNTFTGVVKSEWLKLSSLRSVRFTLILTFLIGFGIMALMATVLNEYAADIFASSGPGNYLLQLIQPPIMFLGLLFGVLGVFAISSEYSSGMILSTLAATPNRGRVFGAKLLVVTVMSLVTAIVTLGLGIVVGIVFQPEAVKGLTDAQFLTGFLGALIFLIGMVWLAFGIAGILRSTAGGIAVVATITFVLPIAFAFGSMAGKTWIDWILNHLPLTLGNFLSTGIMDIPDGWENEFVHWYESAVSMGVWALVFLIPAFFLFLKRDAK